MKPPRQLPAVDPADRDAALALTPVSRETCERLDGFVRLLLERQAVMNLMAASTIPTLWTRHIADSLQLLPLIGEEAKTIVDLGSGGGFPGLVLACALADRPGAVVHLVEATQKKAAFLRETAAALGLPAVVHAERVEDFNRRKPVIPDIITARALAPLPVLLGYVYPLLRKRGRALLAKGQDVEAELTQASISWKITADLVPSRTSPEGRIVVIRGLEARAR
jgi:16S rRNA (guanine527-N7)-methyltransferase